MKANEIYQNETGDPMKGPCDCLFVRPKYFFWLERRAEALEEVRRILNSAYDPYSAHDIADILGKISRLVGVE
jgi:hypothetical protein